LDAPLSAPEADRARHRARDNQIDKGALTSPGTLPSAGGQFRAKMFGWHGFGVATLEGHPVRVFYALTVTSR